MDKQEYQKRLEEILNEQFKRLDGTEVLPIYNRPTAVAQALQAICLLNEEAIKAIEPSPYLLGCEKHWSDDSSGTCTCDSNKSSFRTGANETKQELKQIIGVSNE